MFEERCRTPTSFFPSALPYLWVSDRNTALAQVSLHVPDLSYILYFHFVCPSLLDSSLLFVSRDFFSVSSFPLAKSISSSLRYRSANLSGEGLAKSKSQKRLLLFCLVSSLVFCAYLYRTLYFTCTFYGYNVWVKLNYFIFPRLVKLQCACPDQCFCLEK